MTNANISYEESLLQIASLFEGRFSIDWIQTLSGAKITQILKAFKQFCHDGILKELDVGIFAFVNAKTKQQLEKIISVDLGEKLHKQIVHLLLDEIPDGEGLLRVAGHLLKISDNDIEGCRLLYQAGQDFRKSGHSEDALKCYEKAIKDLKKLEGVETDMLFVENVIGYSKDRQAIRHVNKTVSYLQEAFERAEKHHNLSLQALILMQLSSYTYISQDDQKAKEYLDCALALAKTVTDPKVERAIITRTIVSDFYSGRYQSVIKKYEAAQPLFVEKYATHRLSLRMGVYVGLSYAFLGHISQGAGLLEDVRVNSLEIKDHDTAAAASIDMGFVLILANKIDEATRLLSRVTISCRGVNRFFECFGLFFLSYCFFKNEELEESVRCLTSALTMADKNNYGVMFIPLFLEMCQAMDLGKYPIIAGVPSLRQIVQNWLDHDSLVTRGIAHRIRALKDKHYQTSENRFLELSQSLALLEESGYAIEIAKTKLELGYHFRQTGDEQKATSFLTAAVKKLYPIDRQLVPADLEFLVGDALFEDNILSEIFNLSQRIGSVRNTTELVLHVLSIANRTIRAERAAIFVKPNVPDETSAKLWAARNLTAKDLAQPEFSASNNFIQEVIKTGQPKVGTLFDISGMDVVDNDQVKSYCCVPLLLRGDAIGALYHDNRFLRNTFQDRDVRTLSYFASLFAIILDSIQAHEEVRFLHQQLSEERHYLEEQQFENFNPDDVVGTSSAMKHVLSMVQRVAPSETTVLILGETGVGKEMIAQIIQRNSTRRDKPFVRVHCSALPESLISSELFGHERGAFTGATERRIGRFELADGGTLFLDEIGELTADIQVRLLRVLQTKEFERVGGRETLRSDFRLLAATNRNLAEEVTSGRFRSDLYYRLNVFPIIVPALRQRREDIPLLANYFLRKYSDKMGKSITGIPEKEMNKLVTYDWPGNVRELQNIIERGVILSAGPFYRTPRLSASSAVKTVDDQLTLREMEQRFIEKVLEKTKWKISGPGGAAEILNVNHSTLNSKIKKLGIARGTK